MYNRFFDDIEAGGLLEQIVDNEFAYQGLPLYKPEGHDSRPVDFDRFLPDQQGRLELKFDLKSGFTGMICAEDKLWDREWDFLWHTTLMHKVYTRQEYWDLFHEGFGRKRLELGQAGNWGTAVPISAMKQAGRYSNQFIRLYDIYKLNQAA